MPKIYVKKLNMQTFLEKVLPKALRFEKKSEEIIQILSKRGIYKIVNNELFLYKLQNKQTLNINNDFFITNYYWKKIKNSEYPFEHFMIKISKEKYFITDNIQLILEKRKNIIIDFYFKTTHSDYEKNIADITSFLSNLK